ncbi:MAG: type II toxin-antitoxin system VapC family toxin [Elusimicrobiota bacterium]
MSGFLIDTNVISELIKSTPKDSVIDWIKKTPEELLYLSVLTIGEIRKGASRIPSSRRRVEIESWIETDLIYRFEKRVLPITYDIVDRWGQLDAFMESKGSLVCVIDGLLVATAFHHHLTLVTRNTKDIEKTGIEFFDPWSE